MSGPDDRLQKGTEPDGIDAAMASNAPGDSADSQVAFPHPSAANAVAVAPGAGQPTWLHPTSLLFDLISHFRQLLIPVALVLFGAAQGNQVWTILAIVMFFPAVLFSAFQYFTLRYRVADGEMTIRKGLIFRQLRTIPVNRIQNIDLVQNPLHRMLGVAEVRVETASGTETEARLRVLSMAQIAALRQEIFSEQQLMDEPPALAPAVESPDEQIAASRATVPSSRPAVPEVALLRIPTGWLVRAGLASNRGMLLIGVVMGLAWQFEQEWMFDFRQLLQFLPRLDGSLLGVVLASLAVIGVLLLLRLFGIAWYVLRFHNYSLTRHGEDLRISCGLFTRVSATIPRKRIQFISVHRPLVMRWMGLAAVRIETAGGGGGQTEDASAMVSRRWFVPVIAETQLPHLLAELRPGMIVDEQSLDWKPLASNARPRIIRLAVIHAVILAAAFAVATRPWDELGQINSFAGTDAASILAARPWGYALVIVLAPMMVMWAIRKSRSMRYCRAAGQIAWRSGVFNRKLSFTFFDKIQTAKFSQSPFDRRWNQAVLAIDTAAAGPADHVIEVPWLDAQFANEEYWAISQIAAQHRPDFG